MLMRAADATPLAAPESAEGPPQLVGSGSSFVLSAPFTDLVLRPGGAAATTVVLSIFDAATGLFLPVANVVFESTIHETTAALADSMLAGTQNMDADQMTAPALSSTETVWPSGWAVEDSSAAVEYATGPEFFLGTHPALWPASMVEVRVIEGPAVQVVSLPQGAAQ